ncbi:cell wall-associated NlpC family hydrolase [Neorhizobium galegae]|uniref:hypothetical protein n=1 Tax=Neorhizobium galegae TaxID=399 RepID=UPI001AEA41E6|nr:hypothetical protein [Neorhizobium galegae]MBP2558519.1 cell wall-associated NlpC family hydrolase [Neorhizobium galegae]
MTDDRLDLSRSPIEIPKRFRDVRYNADHFPGAPAVRDVEGGANCQQYVFSLLRHHGFEIPDFRSRELWEDTVHTKVSEAMQPFDIVLVHNQPKIWGAHVGLCVDDGRVLHLSRSIDAPALETLDEMQARDEYRYLIGFKTVLVRHEKGSTLA